MMIKKRRALLLSLALGLGNLFCFQEAIITINFNIPTSDDRGLKDTMVEFSSRERWNIKKIRQKIAKDLKSPTSLVDLYDKNKTLLRDDSKADLTAITAHVRNPEFEDKKFFSEK